MAQEEKKIKRFDYIVVGGGVGGGYAVHELIQQGTPKGAICLISSESVLPYERPALSKGYLLGKAKLPGFNTAAFLGASHDQNWYDNHGVTVKLNTTVTKIGFDDNQINMEDAKGNKSIVQYGYLLVATGCSVIKLSDFKMEGSDLKGLYYLRNYADGEQLLNSLKNAENLQAVVMGGGYIGLETTAAMIQQGVKNITMVFPENHFMELSIWNKDIAQHYEKFYEQKGVKILKGRKVTKFEGKDDQVTHAVLDNGEKLETNFVVVGIGARPCLDLLKDNPKLKFDKNNRGILVNGSLQIPGYPNIYAVGDIISFQCSFTGTRERLEHVRHARASAIHAVHSILGKKKEKYNFLPVFYSRFFDKDWIFYGDRLMSAKDRNIITIGDFKPKGLSLFTHRTKVHGIFLESGTEDEIALVEKLVREKVSIKNVNFNDIENDVSAFLNALKKRSNL